MSEGMIAVVSIVVGTVVGWAVTMGIFWVGVQLLSR